VPHLLLIDDDKDFLQVLGRALGRRGLEVLTASDSEEAQLLVSERCPDYAVMDLTLGQSSGLDLIEALRSKCPAMGIVMLTGYASLPTAVQAVKLGAVNYLAKPATVAEILAALCTSSGTTRSAVESTKPLSVERLEWEHIQRVLADHQGNISATARALNMHRRTLQRKLWKNPAKQ
jgi:two-component system, response regulator RegA